MLTELMPIITQLAIIIVVGLIGYGFQRLYAGLPADKQAALKGLANQAVTSIEQGSASLESSAKKTVAMNIVRTGLNAIGIKGIPDSVISAAIEAEVFAVKKLAGDPTATLVVSPPTPANTAPTK